MKLKTMGGREAALEYAERGWAVLPLLPRKKDPHFDLVQRAYLSATTKSELINFWFDYNQDINIGIACYQSGIVVFDIDFRNGGNIDERFDPTYTDKTGDVFAGKLETGIDIKWKGYVAAAPSTHPSGATYTVVDDRNPVVLPEQLREWASK